MNLSNVNVIVTLTPGNVSRTRKQQEDRKFGNDKKHRPCASYIGKHTVYVLYVADVRSYTPIQYYQSMPRSFLIISIFASAAAIAAS